jgi:RNA polymerase sigma-70 factor (ECF subfamily)
MALPVRSSKAVDDSLPIATLHRFREGDAAAFVEIMQTYQPLVRSAAARYFRSEFEREEAMQEIWLHVFRQRETLDPARFESFSGWLAVLSRRRCIDVLRRPFDPADDSDAAATADWLTAEPEQERAAETAELLAAVETFRTRLKPIWRSFFDAYFVEGLDYEELGKRLSIGKLRCKYMRKVLALRARRSKPLMAALGHFTEAERRHAS